MSDTKGICPKKFIPKIESLCKELNYEFLGFAGEDNGSSTKLMLKCIKHNNTWSTTHYTSFMTMGTRCKMCRVDNIPLKITDEYLTKDLVDKNLYPEDTVLTRSHKAESGSWIWKLKCPVCSNDEYTKNGLCTGVFDIDYSDLLKGRKPCRCHKAPHWTAEQRQYQINKIIDETNSKYKFLDWAEEYHGRDTLLNIYCPDHGGWCVSVNHFIHGDSRCAGCARGGFSKKGDGRLYVLYCENREGVSFTGYGITKDEVHRLKTHSCNLRKKGFNIIKGKVFFAPGEVAYKVEKLLKKKFEVFPTGIIGFQTESSSSQNYEIIIDFVQKQISHIRGIIYESLRIEL